MNLNNKVVVLSFLMFAFIIVSGIHPNFLTIFFATAIASGLMVYLTISVLKDDQPELGDYPIESESNDDL